jgi:hypothetical protein
VFERLCERARSILRGTLPGWAALLLGIVTGIPDWKSRLDFWINAAATAGGTLSTIATIITSPYFPPGLAIAGFAYLLLVGESQIAVLRNPWWPYVGGIIVSICFTAVAITAMVGVFMRLH